MEQLSFQGKGFEKTKGLVEIANALIKDIFIPEIQRELNSHTLLIFDVKPPHELQMLLFEREPTCTIRRDVGEAWLVCHLGEAHSGDHYDAWERLYWSPR